MELPRRKFLHLFEDAAVLPTISRIASAQSYPTRPVRTVSIHVLTFLTSVRAY
jgi:hypothetical protein